MGIIQELIRNSSREKIILPIALKAMKLRIVNNIELREQKHKYCTIQFGNSEHIKTGASYILGKTPLQIQDRMNQEFTILNPWISEVHNAQLVGSKAVGFDQQGNIISSSTLPPKEHLQHRYEGGLPVNTLLIKHLPTPKTKQLDIACSLVNHWSKNYYHWIIDSLTRIEGIEYYQKQTGCKPLIIIDNNPYSWQVESLKVLGYSSDDYIQWNCAKANVKKLILPSFRRQGEWVSPSALHWLRQRILNNLPLSNTSNSTYSPFIYISRIKASGRRVINEDEVMEFLKPLGFVSYSLEEMSFVEQVRLFSTAKMVIAPHGAGLTNIIFSPPNTNLIEFVTPWVSSGYLVPAAILGFKHSCLECKQPKTQEIRQTRGNLIVDIKKLQSLIHQINI
jgi:hypothetical protein